MGGGGIVRFQDTLMEVADNNQFFKVIVVLLYWVQQTVFWTQNKRLLQISIKEESKSILLFVT